MLMSRVSQWVALRHTCPWSYAQCPACGPIRGLAEGHSMVLAEILSRAHVPRPDHTYHRHGRAAAPGLCPRTQPDAFLRAFKSPSLALGASHLQTGYTVFLPSVQTFPLPATPGGSQARDWEGLTGTRRGLLSYYTKLIIFAFEDNLG